MPLPSPRKKTQTKQQFMSSCMSNSVMVKEYPDQKQRAAVCFSQWGEKTKKASSVIATATDEFATFDEPTES